MPKPVEPVPVPVKKGTIDLKNWKVRHKNADGSISTIRSMSFSDDSGLEILVPTFSSDGRKLTESQAIEQYYATGKHLGKFRTPQDATTFANWLHDSEAKKIESESRSKLRVRKVGQ